MFNINNIRISVTYAFLVTVASYFMTFPNPATAQINTINSNQSSMIVLETITLRDLQILLEKEGYTIDYDKKGLILWKIDGYKTLLKLNGTGDSLHFVSILKGGNATLRKINDWNRNTRFCRGSMDDEGNALLFVDLDLTGGVTTDRIKDYFRTCRQLFQEWIRQVMQ